MNDVSFAKVSVGDQAIDLEYVWIAPDNTGPLLIFLHEGLGSVALWRDFPEAVCEASGCRGLVYSRAGYGRSTPRWATTQWPIDFMHIEALELLPQFLNALGVDAAAEPPILFGHSDGASIALIYAAAFPDRASGVIALAPHVFVEALTIEGIAKARDQFQSSDLPVRLGRYHQDVQAVFWGWSNVWLHPEFKTWNIQPMLETIQCPLLLIQGLNDQYGTLAQIERISAAIPTRHAVMLDACGHAPHVEQPARVLEAIERFLPNCFPAARI